MTSITVEVEVNGIPFKHTATAADTRTAKKIASKQVLKCLKEQTLWNEFGKQVHTKVLSFKINRIDI